MSNSALQAAISKRGGHTQIRAEKIAGLRCNLISAKNRKDGEHTFSAPYVVKPPTNGGAEKNIFTYQERKDEKSQADAPPDEDNAKLEDQATECFPHGLGCSQRFIPEKHDPHLTDASTQNPMAGVVEDADIVSTVSGMNEFMDAGGYEKQYIAAIYKKLEPASKMFASTLESEQALDRSIAQKLASIESGQFDSTVIRKLTSTTTETFNNEKESSYLLLTRNGETTQELTRTKDEIELHLLIENHLIAIGQASEDADAFALAGQYVKADVHKAPFKVPKDSVPKGATVLVTEAKAVAQESSRQVRDAGKPFGRQEPSQLQAPGQDSTSGSGGLGFFPNHVVADVHKAPSKVPKSTTAPVTVAKAVAQQSSIQVRDAGKPVARQERSQLQTRSQASAWGSGGFRFFPNDVVNVTKFTNNLLASGARIQNIGGGNCNCWMRAAWMSSFIQCKNPDYMKQLLMDELKTQLHEKVHPRKKPPADAVDQLPTIADQIDILHAAVVNFRKGKLQEVHSSSSPFKKDVDDAITVLSRALLIKDLEDDRLEGTVATRKRKQIDDSTIGPEMGDTDQIRIIMRKLGVDTIVTSLQTNCTEIDLASEHILNQIDLQLSTAYANNLAPMLETNHVPADHALQYAGLREAAQTIPVLRHSGSHFELYTYGCIWRTGD